MAVGVSLLDRLASAGLLIPTGINGILARSATFEAIVEALEALIGRIGAPDGAELLRFPPATARSQLVRSGYLKSFPQLLGTIHCFCGSDADHRAMLRLAEEGKEWTEFQNPTEVLLTPASCYPLYPIVAGRGTLSPQGGVYDVQSWCFRHEPSTDPARMQCFRLREFVRIGSSEQVLEFRQLWLQRAAGLARELALPCTIDVAHDPFFGRTGRLIADSQREQRLKYELLIPVGDEDRQTACMSFNYHLDHFGQPWDIRQADGRTAFSGCVGFGLERLVLALLYHHGLEPAHWPATVLRALRLHA